MYYGHFHILLNETIQTRKKVLFLTQKMLFDYTWTYLLFFETNMYLSNNTWSDSPLSKLAILVLFSTFSYYLNPRHSLLWPPVYVVIIVTIILAISSGLPEEGTSTSNRVKTVDSRARKRSASTASRMVSHHLGQKMRVTISQVGLSFTS